MQNQIFIEVIQNHSRALAACATFLQESPEIKPEIVDFGYKFQVKDLPEFSNTKRRLEKIKNQRN